MEGDWHETVSRIKCDNRAAQVVDLLKQGSPSVTVFEWNEDDAIADGLKIKRFDDYCEEWAEFVLKNRDRHQPQPVHDYDIVVGPIADDGVTFQLSEDIPTVLSR